MSYGHERPEPMVVNLPKLHEEAAKVAELLSAAHQEGHAWGDLTVLCWHNDEMQECARALTRRRLPHQVRKGSGDFRPLEDSVKVMTMHASKCLKFFIVAPIIESARIFLRRRNKGRITHAICLQQQAQKQSHYRIKYSARLTQLNKPYAEKHSRIS